MQKPRGRALFVPLLVGALGVVAIIGFLKGEIVPVVMLAIIALADALFLEDYRDMLDEADRGWKEALDEWGESVKRERLSRDPRFYRLSGEE